MSISIRSGSQATVLRDSNLSILPQTPLCTITVLRVKREHLTDPRGEHRQFVGSIEKETMAFWRANCRPRGAPGYSNCRSGIEERAGKTKQAGALEEGGSSHNLPGRRLGRVMGVMWWCYGAMVLNRAWVRMWRIVVHLSVFRQTKLR